METIERQSNLLDQRLSTCNAKWSLAFQFHSYLRGLSWLVNLISVLAPIVLTGSLGFAAIGADRMKEFLSTDTGQWFAVILALVSAILSGFQARQKLPEQIARLGRRKQAYEILIGDIERFRTLQHNEDVFQKFLARIDERMTFIDQDQVEQAQEEIETQKALDRIEQKLSLIEQNQSGTDDNTSKGTE